MFLLLIGPMPPPLGGATVLFEQLVDSLDAANVDEIRVINTGGGRGLFHIIRVLGGIFRYLHKADVVSFHASLRGALLFMPILSLLCFLYRLPIIFRGFGGNYPDFYNNLGRLKKFFFQKTILSADIALFETIESVDFFSSFSSGSVRWYPNSRPISEKKISSNSLRKACFISQIKSDKGIFILSDSVSDLDAGFQVDCFGPLLHDVTEDFFETSPLNYKGVLHPDQIRDTLLNYDILIFPTYYSGEGYPGVILEAFSVGMPVITTDWRCIPEIVDKNCGILVNPKDKSELLSAIETLLYDSDAYNKLQTGAREKGELFDSAGAAKIFLEFCGSVSRNKI